MKEQINKLLLLIKSKFDFFINDIDLISISLIVSRCVDKKITKYINENKVKGIKINSIEKKFLRRKIIYEHITTNSRKIISEKDIENALLIILAGIEINSDKVIGTIRAQLHENNNESNIDEYLSFIQEREQNLNQLLILNVNENITNEILAYNILNEYSKITNYGYLAIIFTNRDWSKIAEIALFCENMYIEKDFNVFNKCKNEKIAELLNFLHNNNNISYTENIRKHVENFFLGVSYGFQFNDLFVSSNSDKVILIMQKIKLDESSINCPDCMKDIVRGNSYSKLLQKSFECQNPHCPSRSKIGRGKRFDYFSIKRNIYLHLNHDDDHINSDLVKQYRKDIYIDSENIMEMLSYFYSFHDSKIKIISDNLIDVNKIKRTFKQSNFISKTHRLDYFPLNSLLREIIRNIDVKRVSNVINKNIQTEYSIYLGNSSNIVYNINEKIDYAITSPPYYNAREYSQWPSLICYLVDMAISAKAIYDNISDDGIYFYNIGDIVGQDNVYVSSLMSKKRLMLGFLSVFIFKAVGWNLVDDIIWYKGEVQSKRNSSENVFPTYIKPVNCYEHIFIFSKKRIKMDIASSVIHIEPVKKINSKGENMLGHTAPYPCSLVDHLLSLLQNEGYVLDPFLGSGTTVISSIKNGFKAIGIEYNEKYYNLANKRINDEYTKISIEHFL